MANNVENYASIREMEASLMLFIYPLEDVIFVVIVQDISINDIIFCIHEGEIIEQYPDDYPYPSCLILGFSMKKKYIHVVIGTDLETLWIITAYYPNLDKWKQDLRTRR